MELYNQAIQLIQDEEYIEAELLLKEIFDQSKGYDEVNWALGLIQVYLGYPHKSLYYWQYITDRQDYDLDAKIESIESALPVYDELYSRYNEALMYAGESRHQEAFAIFQELLDDPNSLPLEMYSGYLLTAIQLNKNAEITKLLEKVPAYVSSSQVFIKVKSVLKAQAQIDTAELQTVSDWQHQNEDSVKKLRSYKKINKGLIGSLSAAAVGLIVLAAFLLSDTDEVTQPIAEKEQSPIVADAPDESSATDDTVRQLDQQILDLRTELDETNSEAEQVKQREALLAEAGISMDEMVSQAEFSEYNKGYALYQQGRYEESLRAFSNSTQWDQESYYADDAMYYAIQAKRKLGQGNIMEDYDQFLSYETENFSDSPYYDDVLLEKAEMLLGEGNEQQATELLEQILTDYPNEWTASVANRLVIGLED